MGNHRFRLSDMMPNAWFYKLKSMGSSKPSSQKRKQKQKQKQKQPPSKSKSASATTKTAQQQQQQLAHHQPEYPRKSYYFTRELTPGPGDRFCNSPHTKTKSSSTGTHFLDPPRKSSKQKRNRTRPSPPPSLKQFGTSSSSVSAGCSCRATIWTKTEPPPPDSSTSSASTLDSSPETEQVLENCYRSDRVLVADTCSSSCGCNKNNSENIEIKVVGVDKKSLVKNLNYGLESLSDLELPPIITKPAATFDKQNKDSDEPTQYRLSSAKVEQKGSPGLRKCYVNNSAGVRLRVKMNSPRVTNRKVQGRRRSITQSNSSSSASSRRSNLSESFAVIKSSFDPQRDFRESMVEMIVGNNIRASKDLEELLACYLSLNSDEYHELIIKVFKQIWFDLTDIKLKP